MKKTKYWIRALLIVSCLAMLIPLCSCTADMNIGNNTELGDRFIDCLIDNNRNDAYDLMKNTVTPADFNEYWVTILPIAEGAESYEMEQIGWNVSKSNGRTVRVTAYQVNFDNGKNALLRVTTYDDIVGIAGIHISDITEFVTKTGAFVPSARVGLLVLSLLAIAFSVWMLVDCLRRKIKLKVLWVILLFFGTVVTFTFGETGGLHFALGLIFKMNTIVADPAILSVKIQLVVPVGAIVYFILRKRLAVAPPLANDAAALEEISTMDNEFAEKETSSTDRT